MKIALLLCGGSTPELQAAFGAYQSMFLSIINATDKLDVFAIHALAEMDDAETLVYQTYFPNIEKYDGFIVSGSKAGVYDDYCWLDPLFDYIRAIVASNKKLLGVCFGHQAINHALGGKVVKSEKGWGIGHYPNKWYEHAYLAPYFQSGSELYLLTFHQDQIVLLAPEFEILAGSEFSPYFVTQYKNQILTTQGHPEMTSNYIAALSYAYEDMVGQDVAEKGRNSLMEEDDTESFRQFIREFWLK